VQVSEIADGLWRWTGFHPEWKDEVGCAYLRAPDAIVLVDPIVPPEDTDRFLRHLDEDVRWVQRPMHILLTVYWHTRSAAELARRYDAAVWAPVRSALPVERRTQLGIRRVRPDDELPGSVAALPSGRAGEVVYYLPSHETLVTGDVLLGGPLRICPDSWLGKGGRAAVRDALTPLLDLPLKRVLVSHGEPVVEGGAAALRTALNL
jgi:glyoxylase-like metal-dependent hydrolase (beta-lactamase superfamily II)